MYTYIEFNWFLLLLQLPGRDIRRMRKIYHYQYVGWPDHGVPSDPASLLDMLALIEATQKTFQYPGPPVVHCRYCLLTVLTCLYLKLIFWVVFVDIYGMLYNRKFGHVLADMIRLI